MSRSHWVPNDRRGVTLVEVLVSVAILGLAMAPIVGIVHRSFSDIRKEKDEATAANFAGQLLNQILFEAPYADVYNQSYTSPAPESEPIIPSGNRLGSRAVDGTELEWRVTVNRMNDLRFLYRQLTYHPGETGGETRDIAGFPLGVFQPVGSTNDQGADDRQFNNPPLKIDKKFTGSYSSVMCEVMLEIRWRPPGGTWSPYEKLYVRRAKLE